MRAFIGAGSILAIQGVAEIPPTSNLVEIVKIIIQIVIAIPTLWHLIKKRKPE